MWEKGGGIGARAGENEEEMWRGGRESGKNCRVIKYFKRVGFKGLGVLRVGVEWRDW